MPPPNTGANRSDKVLASEAPDKMLTKVIPTWIVDRKLFGFCNILKAFEISSPSSAFCSIRFLLIETTAISEAAKKH